MTDGERLVKIYDLGREQGMTHEESLNFARLIEMHFDSIDSAETEDAIIDRLRSTAYIAIREQFPAEDAVLLVSNYITGLKAILESYVDELS